MNVQNLCQINRKKKQPKKANALKYQDSICFIVNFLVPFRLQLSQVVDDSYKNVREAPSEWNLMLSELNQYDDFAKLNKAEKIKELTELLEQVAWTDNDKKAVLHETIEQIVADAEMSKYISNADEITG